MGWRDDDSFDDSDLLGRGSEACRQRSACLGLTSLFVALGSVTFFVISATITTFFCEPLCGGPRLPDLICLLCVAAAYISLAAAGMAILIGFFGAPFCNVLGKRCALSGIVVGSLYLLGALQLISVGAPFWDW